MLRNADSLLKEAGFTVSEICCSRPSCFDFVARKDKITIFIKSQSDIGSIPSGDSLELKAISESVSAASLLVGEKARERPLEDDTVYTRYNILVVTPKTFENIVVQKIYPLVQAGPGGYYVEIDGESIKRRRQELGLSSGEMAKRIGVSRRTLYGYERGMAKASVPATYDLMFTLGIPVAKPVNVFERPRTQSKCFLVKARDVLVRNKLLQKVLGKLARCNVTTINKAPFDFVISIPEEKMRILGGVAGTKERELDRRVDEILSVSKVVRAHPILITDGQKVSDKDIACIYGEQLSRVKNPEDLIANVK